MSASNETNERSHAAEEATRTGKYKVSETGSAWLTVSEVAREAKVKDATVRLWLNRKTGRLIGTWHPSGRRKRWKIKRTDLISFLEGQAYRSEDAQPDGSDDMDKSLLINEDRAVAEEDAAVTPGGKEAVGNNMEVLAVWPDDENETAAEDYDDDEGGVDSDTVSEIYAATPSGISWVEVSRMVEERLAREGIASPYARYIS